MPWNVLNLSQEVPLNVLQQGEGGTDQSIMAELIMLVKVWRISLLLNYLMLQVHSLSAGPLPLSVWRVFPTTVQLDWFTSLEKKHQMVDCKLSYGSEELEDLNNMVDDFMPEHRTFSVAGLMENTSYWLSLVCRDREDLQHHSPVLRFITGTSTRSEPVLEHLQSAGGEEVMVGEGTNRDLRSKTDMLSRHRFRAGGWSPHTVMGAACAVVGLAIMGLTSGLLVRRYRASGGTFPRLDCETPKSPSDPPWARLSLVGQDSEVDSFRDVTWLSTMDQETQGHSYQ